MTDSETQAQARAVVGELHDIIQEMDVAMDRMEHIRGTQWDRAHLRSMRRMVDGMAEAWRRRAGL